MKTFTLKHRVAMTRNSIRKPIQQLSALTGVAVLTAGFLFAPVAVSQTSQKNTADLNFVGADIESVIKAIGHYTGTTFIIDPRVKGQINLVSETPLTKDQAFKLLTSTLRLQGYAVVTADGYSKVVPEADAKLQPGPTQSVQAERNDSAKGDQVVTQIYKLNYESAANVVTILRPLISPNNTVNGNPGNNTVVITDYADNLKRLNKIIAALDVPASVDMDVIFVQHAIASDIVAMVNKIIDSGSGADPARAVLLADPRTNSLLLRAPSVARSNQIKSLIAKLDQPTALPGNVHVVYLKNAEAEKLAQTLRSIVSGDTSSGNKSTSSLSNLGNSANGTNSPLASPNAGAASAPSTMPSLSGSSSSSSSGGGGGAAGYIQADTATNTLIITASEPVYRNLRGVIDQLDARRAQVYVEALIVEVSADKANELGVQWMGLSGDSNSKYRIGGGTSFSTKGDNLLNLAAGNASSAGSVLPGAGLSLGIFKQINGQLGLGALAHVLQTDGNANVLSIPNLVTLDNEEATISVGKNVPLITGQFTTSVTTGSGGVNPFQTIERKTVGLKLKVRPQISEGGTVKLGIYQEVSSIDDTTNTSGIITKERTISTNVLVDDGQIIALGGLIEDTTTDGVEKVTGLGDIPIIGNLFKYQSTKRGKTNLMVFLRPTVIRNAEQSNNISVDRYDYMRTQIAPLKDGKPDALLPVIEKGKLLSTPLTIPAEKPASTDKGSK
ncbi:type II secretion system secretin GspD [Undibacterium sp. TJN19]|uniref:type II secretion system secretin GspD n=1 Tax=Undibacterium sp. TJN19 TaxID=3413055 RepID=UPI003BF1007A